MMTKRLECYTRTTKAKALFRSFFDSDEDFLAFNLKHSVQVDNHMHHARVRVLNDKGSVQSFDGKPAFVEHDIAGWTHGGFTYLTLNLSDQSECNGLCVQLGRGPVDKENLKHWAKQLGNTI